MTKQTPDAAIAMKTLPNLRDLGGYKTDAGGTVRTGVLYRSAALCDISGDDVATLDALKIKTVIDLRGEREREKRPDRVPAGARVVHADVIADSDDPAQDFRGVVSPAQTNAAVEPASMTSPLP